MSEQLAVCRPSVSIGALASGQHRPYQVLAVPQAAEEDAGKVDVHQDHYRAGSVVAETALLGPHIREN
ncbi:hypothetical protein [Herminiimonas sp. CN]|uniref:hypothetical protein n=1 Tax=Herminiimonas sp. CN TaxID=1349818 RepID=UPI0012DBFBA3|nr:hypothetical protein [Herminiimonas sp. CN]